jgi:hypothetical protein
VGGGRGLPFAGKVRGARGEGRGGAAEAGLETRQKSRDETPTSSGINPIQFDWRSAYNYRIHRTRSLYQRSPPPLPHHWLGCCGSAVLLPLLLSLISRNGISTMGGWRRLFAHCAEGLIGRKRQMPLGNQSTATSVLAGTVRTGVESHDDTYSSAHSFSLRICSSSSAVKLQT